MIGHSFIQLYSKVNIYCACWV